MLRQRQRVTVRWAKSRQTSTRSSNASRAVRVECACIVVEMDVAAHEVDDSARGPNQAELVAHVPCDLAQTMGRTVMTTQEVGETSHPAAPKHSVVAVAARIIDAMAIGGPIASALRGLINQGTSRQSFSSRRGPVQEAGPNQDRCYFLGLARGAAEGRAICAEWHLGSQSATIATTIGQDSNASGDAAYRPRPGHCSRPGP
jgi:hypothetical protein